MYIQVRVWVPKSGKIALWPLKHVADVEVEKCQGERFSFVFYVFVQNLRFLLITTCICQFSSTVRNSASMRRLTGWQFRSRFLTLSPLGLRWARHHSVSGSTK